MKNFRTQAFQCCAIAIFFIALYVPTSVVQAQQKTMTIGTGGEAGVYFTVGAAICRMVNKGSAIHGYDCSFKSTRGSMMNIVDIMASDLDFGLARTDWQYRAYSGTGRFNYNQVKDLRSVFALYAEPFTVVSRAEANITKFEDFSGKRFNVGNPRSSAAAATDELLSAMGWKRDNFGFASELKTSELGPALCDNKIDGFLTDVGHPTASIRNTIVACGAKLVPLTGPAVDKLVKENSFYAKTTIAGGLYDGHPNPTPTYGFMASFVTLEKASEESVYTLVKAVFENFDEFKKLHPAFGNLDPNNMIKDGLTAPLHPGAVKYYKEKGWM